MAGQAELNEGSPIGGEDLERLIVSDKDFLALENALGRFCPFEALNIVRGEVPIGNLLANLLDPNGPHGLGTKLLRTFLMEAVRSGRSFGGDTEGLIPLNMHLLDLDEAEVHREWRRIDILIRLDHAKLVVAIELKIDSKQGYNQLTGYRQTIEAEFSDPSWRKLYVFLTVHPEMPLDPVWIPLRFEVLVPALERVNVAEADPAATGILSSFLAMIRRHHLTDEILEEISRKLWANHKAALTFLADRRPDGMRGVFASLRDQLVGIAKQLGGKKFTFEADKSTASMLRFACQQWDSLPGFTSGSNWTPSGRMVLFELKREGEAAVAYVYLGPGPKTIRKFYVEGLGAHRHRRDMQPGDEYMCVLKKQLFVPKANEDLDVGKARAEIIQKFSEFCEDAAARFDQPLRDALASATG